MHSHNLVHEDHDLMTRFAVGWRPGRLDPTTRCWPHPPPSTTSHGSTARDRRTARPTVGVGRRRVTLEWDEPALGGATSPANRIRGHSRRRRLVDVTVGERRRHTVDGPGPR
ncbi:MAG: hypothetical protein M3211_12570 [Actinomycetota bacterium]|nr:hypothetical protein [Actinomycetota bacterium]